MANTLTIGKDDVVRIDVKMYDLQGNLLEETPDGGVEYLHGHGDIFPGIEAKLEGKKVGDSVTVQLEPEDSFGEFDEEGVFIVPVDKLGDPELIVPGLVFDHVPGLSDDGRKYRVTDVAEGVAVLDCNHPLAGWTLKFVVTVLGITQGEGETTGNDDVVVPGFLGFADKIIDDETD